MDQMIQMASVGVNCRLASSSWLLMNYLFFIILFFFLHATWAIINFASLQNQIQIMNITYLYMCLLYFFARSCPTCAIVNLISEILT